MQKVLRTLEQRPGRHCSGWYPAGLALGLALIFASRALEIAIAYGLTSDLSYIWAGPRAALLGYDPYDPVGWSAATNAFGTQVGGPPVYSYPPDVLVLLIPIGLLPLGSVFVAWMVVPFALAALALRALLAIAVPADRTVHALAALALVVSQPGVVAMRTGQWSYFLLAALAGSVVLMRHGHAARGAIAGSVLLVKAHLAVVALPALVLGAPRAVRRRAAAWIGALIALPVLLTLAARPSWWVAWLAWVPPSRAGEAHVTTAWRVLGDAAGGAGIPLAAVLLAASLALMVVVRSDGEAITALGLATSLTFAPYMRSYDQLLLLVPLVLAARLVLRRSAHAATALGGAALAAFTAGTWAMIDVVAEARGSESLSWLVAFAVLLLVAGVIVATPRTRDAL